MTQRAFIFVIIIAIVFAAIVFQLVRQRRLSEKYALLWIGIACVSVAIAFAANSLGAVARFVGVAYPPAALFAVAIVVLLLLILHLYTTISRLTSDVTLLLQEVAILREQADEQATHPESHTPPS